MSNKSASVIFIRYLDKPYAAAFKVLLYEMASNLDMHQYFD